MIPAFSVSGVLPPHMGDPRDPTQVSPYPSTTEEFVSRYCLTEERASILSGLLDYRQELHSKGISSGFQLLDGSFSENLEATELRAPRDIDVVTFARRPSFAQSNEEILNFAIQNPNIFQPQEVKKAFKCDAYWIDLNVDPLYIVTSTMYWYGLFSHRRDGLWKGMIRIELGTDDSAARLRLRGATTS